VTTSTYNAGGQLIGTDASGTLTTYTYDASGNLAAEVTSTRTPPRPTTPTTLPGSG